MGKEMMRIERNIVEDLLYYEKSYRAWRQVAKNRREEVQILHRLISDMNKTIKKLSQ